MVPNHPLRLIKSSNADMIGWPHEDLIVMKQSPQYYDTQFQSAFKQHKLNRQSSRSSKQAISDLLPNIPTSCVSVGTSQVSPPQRPRPCHANFTSFFPCRPRTLKLQSTPPVTHINDPKKLLLPRTMYRHKAKGQP